MEFSFVSKTKINSVKSVSATSIRLVKTVFELDKRLATSFMLSTSASGVLPFVNAYIYAQIINFVVHFISTNNTSYNQLIILICFRLLTMLIEDVNSTLTRKYEKQLWVKLPMHMNQKVLSHVSELDLEYFENDKFNDKLNNAKENMNWRPINMFQDICWLFQSLLTVLIATISILYLNWMFAILILLSAIPTLIYQLQASKAQWTIWDADTSIRKRHEYISRLVSSNLSVKELKLFDLYKEFLKNLRTTNQVFAKKNDKILQKAFRRGVLSGLVDVAVYLGIEIYIIFQALHRNISLGSLSYYTQVLINFQGGVNGAFRHASNIFDKSQYIAELFEVIDYEPKIVNITAPVVIQKNHVPKIEFRNVTFSYPGSSEKILDDFSIIIEPSTKVAFVGENGAGKTTIIKLLARFYDVDDGSILIDGTDIKHIDLKEWHQQIGILFQDFLRYEYSLGDNIYFGQINSPIDRNKIIDSAEKSGADKIASKYPNQYDQMLGNSFADGVDLSTGQWQKVALARGFYRDASLLVLDEPTAAIDAKAENEIFDKVEKLTNDKTVIIISHRFSTVKNADKIYVIENGKIKESGTHKKLMEHKGVYANLFNLQAEAYR